MSRPKKNHGRGRERRDEHPATRSHCLPSQQATVRAMLDGEVRGLMYYMDVQAATGEDGWVETPHTVEVLRRDKENRIM